MSWLVLVVSGVLEAVRATALGRSEGFSRLWPSVVFAGALVASMAGPAFAMREPPVGTSYAVWVGIGAETVSVVKVLLLAGIVGTDPRQSSSRSRSRSRPAGSTGCARFSVSVSTVTVPNAPLTSTTT
jgi:quaternary ammonium compound-resistance protein SugE